MGAEFIIYLLKASGALALFAVIYALLLRRDGYLKARRGFLIAAIALSFSFEFIPSPLPALRVESTPLNIDTIQDIEESQVAIGNTSSSISVTSILFAVWAAVAFILFTRLLFALFTIIKMRRSATKARAYGVDYLIYSGESTPFSFFGWVFLSKDDPINEDILAHELAHRDGWHSLDMIVAQVVVIVLWFNPFAWVVRREIDDNLEFIADREVITAGVDKREYQHALLKHYCQRDKNIVATYFNHSQIKNRIIMMNRSKKSSMAVVKYATLPMLLLGLVMTNARATVVESTQEGEVKVVGAGEVNSAEVRSATDIYKQMSPKTNSEGEDPLIIMNGEEITKEQFEALDYEQVASLSILKDNAAIELYGDKGKNGVIVVKSKKSSTEDEIFMAVDTMPLFQGENASSFRSWVMSNLRYPSVAHDANIEGRVIVSFVVEKDGSLSNFSVMNTPHESLSDEVIRILKISPKWTPASQRGEIVRVKLNLPIEFRIKREDKDV